MTRAAREVRGESLARDPRCMVVQLEKAEHGVKTLWATKAGGITPDRQKRVELLALGAAAKPRVGRGGPGWLPGNSTSQEGFD